MEAMPHCYRLVDVLYQTTAGWWQHSKTGVRLGVRLEPMTPKPLLHTQLELEAIITSAIEKIRLAKIVPGAIPTARSYSRSLYSLGSIPSAG